MITIKLSTGETATVSDGVWSVPANAELARVLNLPEMQPDGFGYAASADARQAEHVLTVWGGEWVSSTERATPGKLY